MMHDSASRRGVSGFPPGDAPAMRTPMMRQYLAIKAEHPDCLLFFRMGDFYELFLEDAETAARELDLTLTARAKDEAAIAMAGVPHHAAKGYLARLIEKGYRVAICDQVEDPKAAKGIVRREVTRVVTPGTVIDEESLDGRANNYLAALHVGTGQEGTAPRGTGLCGVAALDVSTGEFAAGEFLTDADGSAEDALIDEVARLAPREVVVVRGHEGFARGVLARAGVEALLTLVDAAGAASRHDEAAAEKVARALGNRDATLAALAGKAAAAEAAACVLRYVEATQKRVAGHIDRIVPLAVGRHLLLDEAAQRNLELVRSAGDGRRKGSLLHAVDGTVTTMGARRLAQWVLSPLRVRDEILERQGAVSFFYDDTVRLEALRDRLTGVADIERLTARAAMGVASPRDLVALRESLARGATLGEVLGEVLGGRAGEGAVASRWVADRLRALVLPEGFLEVLAGALRDDAPLTLSDGGIFRRGYRADLDELIDLAENGQARIEELELRERKRTGIASLKLRYNKVFGYYIEVTRANLAQVPAEYERRQTTVGAERFVTPELKELESRVLSARDDRLRLEYDLFVALRGFVAEHAAVLRGFAAAVADLDAAQGLGFVARRHRYVKPAVSDGRVLRIVEGRHAVIEQMNLDEPFVPGDFGLDGDERTLALITGPNMAGKSTVMRQVALIVVLAQMGAFVPAREAEVGLVDRIFTRVGASDRIARGQSTFMVEMIETAAILRNATERSLVVLDEIGRGTSTFDGLSIAWAVTEYLHDRVKCRTLFATHYHELIELADELARAVNLRVEVREVQGRVVFMRKLVEGGASRSYGIEVARLAGLPKTVLERARAVLGQLETAGAQTTSRIERDVGRGRQLSFFIPVEKTPNPSLQRALDELRTLKVDELTPLQALNVLAGLAEKAKG